MHVWSVINRFMFLCSAFMKRRFPTNRDDAPSEKDCLSSQHVCDCKPCLWLYVDTFFLLSLIAFTVCVSEKSHLSDFLLICHKIQFNDY